MSYINENLSQNEQIVYQTKRHWVIFLWPFILTLLALFFLTVESLLVLVGWICLFVAIVGWLSAITTYLTSEFGITNKRVLIKLGFIRRQTYETILSRIAGIQVEQSILGRLLDYGTVIVQSTGGEHGRFHGIDNPLRFRREVQEQIEESLIR